MIIDDFPRVQMPCRRINILRTLCVTFAMTQKLIIDKRLRLGLYHLLAVHFIDSVLEFYSLRTEGVKYTNAVSIL